MSQIRGDKDDMMTKCYVVSWQDPGARKQSTNEVCSLVNTTASI